MRPELLGHGVDGLPRPRAAEVEEFIFAETVQVLDDYPGNPLPRCHQARTRTERTTVGPTLTRGWFLAPFLIGWVPTCQQSIEMDAENTTAIPVGFEPVHPGLPTRPLRITPALSTAIRLGFVPACQPHREQQADDGSSDRRAAGNEHGG